MSQYTKELEFAKKCALSAGERMKQGFSLKADAEWKSDNTPLTEADTAINDQIITLVKDVFPGDGVLGEEASYGLDAKRLWVVDPIDGTKTYDLGAPMNTFCMSLVIDGQPVIGLIYDPYMDNMFWAVKARGAFLNGDVLKVNEKKTFKNSYFIMNGRMPGGKSPGQIMDDAWALGVMPFNFLSFAYSSTFVAAGTAIGAVVGVPKPWDAAASKIIIEEAGGTVTDIHGDDRRYDQVGPGLLVSNGILHEKLLALVKATV